MENALISIVVPIFNEQGNIETLYESISSVCTKNSYRYEILFVDDGSDDGSAERIGRIARSDPHFRYLSLKRNYGQTAALAAGLDHAQGDYVVTMDGDLQNDPNDIPKLIAKCKDGYDLVNGWRRKRKDPFFSVKLPSMIANMIIRKVTSVKIHDTGCTMKIFRKDILDDLHLYGEMHRFIPALLHWSGAKIGEVEVNHRPRTCGTSKYTFGKLFRVVLDILNIKFLISYSTRPMHIFGKFGMYSLFLSFFSFCALVGMKMYWGVDMTGNPFLLLTVFLGFLGIQFVSTGFLAEINIRIYHETTKKKIYKVKPTR
jgi:glycosyltransferase involved in cell wall biosynthesis